MDFHPAFSHAFRVQGTPPASMRQIVQQIWFTFRKLDNASFA